MQMHTALTAHRKGLRLPLPLACPTRPGRSTKECPPVPPCPTPPLVADLAWSLGHASFQDTPRISSPLHAGHTTYLKPSRTHHVSQALYMLDTPRISSPLHAAVAVVGAAAAAAADGDGGGELQAQGRWPSADINTKERWPGPNEVTVVRANSRPNPTILCVDHHMN